MKPPILPPNTGYPHRNAGLTLVELMVAMAVGLLIVLAVLAATMATRSTSRTQTGLVDIQDNQRFLVDFLTMRIRNAGFQWNAPPPPKPEDAPSSFPTNSFYSPFRPPPAGERDCATTAFPLRHAICGTDVVPGLGATPNSDTLVLRYNGMDNANGTGAAVPPITNCAGLAVRDTGFAPITETYRVVRPPLPAEPRLECLIAPAPAGIANPVVLATGVDAMQVLYGYDESPANRLSREKQNSSVLSWGPMIPAQAADIVAVKVSLLLRSPNQTATAPDTNTYRFFDQANATSQWTALGGADHRIRKVVTFTALLGNH